MKLLTTAKQHKLLLECVLLFGGLPLVLLFFSPIKGMFFYVSTIGLLCGIVLWRDAEFDNHTLWRQSEVHWQQLKPVLLRLIPVCIFFTWFTLTFEYDRLLSFPRQRPERWLMIMILYPILSVYPQEVIFRGFFMHRYRALFPDASRMTLASAIAFGYAHVFLQNWIAVISCLLGGYLFARTYQKSRSLLLVTMEHSLYGCFIFTIGLGYYFYSGAVR